MVSIGFLIVVYRHYRLVGPTVRIKAGDAGKHTLKAVVSSGVVDARAGRRCHLPARLGRDPSSNCTGRQCGSRVEGDNGPWPCVSQW